jgi:hypothetical protein
MRGGSKQVEGVRERIGWYRATVRVTTEWKGERTPESFEQEEKSEADERKVKIARDDKRETPKRGKCKTTKNCEITKD